MCICVKGSTKKTIQVNKCIGDKVGFHSFSQTGRLTDSLSVRLTDRQTDRQSDRQTDKFVTSRPKKA